MEEIIKNLTNWKNSKKDHALITNILDTASYFKIDCTAPKDNSEFYHFYPALEENNEDSDSNSYNLIFYMISMNNDKQKFIDKNKESINIYINKFNVIGRVFTQEDTEISKDEATERKKRWRSDEIKKWIAENEVFDVIKIPREDFKFNDKNIVLQGHFGMKDSVKSEDNNSTSYSPDIMIYQIDSLDHTEQYFDMAKLSPPYRSMQRENEFSLLEYIV